MILGLNVDTELNCRYSVKRGCDLNKTFLFLIRQKIFFINSFDFLFMFLNRKLSKDIEVRCYSGAKEF